MSIILSHLIISKFFKFQAKEYLKNFESSVIMSGANSAQSTNLLVPIEQDSILLKQLVIDLLLNL